MEEGREIGEERKIAKKIQSKGLSTWGQLLVDEGGHIKTWEGLKREFNLDRRMRPLVEGRLERVRQRGLKEVERRVIGGKGLDGRMVLLFYFPKLSSYTMD